MCPSGAVSSSVVQSDPNKMIPAASPLEKVALRTTCSDGNEYERLLDSVFMRGSPAYGRLVDQASHLR